MAEIIRRTHRHEPLLLQEQLRHRYTQSAVMSLYGEMFFLIHFKVVIIIAAVAVRHIDNTLLRL